MDEAFRTRQVGLPGCTFVESGKTFLSAMPGEGGSIRWCNEVGEGPVATVDGAFQITDCNKTVYLNFYVQSEDEFKDRMKKISSLIKEAERFQKSLKESWKVAKKHSSKVKKKEVDDADVRSKV